MNVKKAIKLDIISIIPYLTIKNIVLLVFLSSIYAFLFKNPVMTIGVSHIFSVLFSAYPFMVGNEAGIDPLFKIIGLKADDVVKGRYLLAILFVIVMLVVGIIFGAFSSILYPIENIAVILTSSAAIMFILTSLIIFVQYPAYFKIGYLKARAFLIIPFLLVGIVIFAVSRFPIKMQNLIKHFIQYRYIALFVLIVFWCLAFFVSITLSKKFYRQKDF